MKNKPFSRKLGFGALCLGGSLLVIGCGPAASSSSGSLSSSSSSESSATYSEAGKTAVFEAFSSGLRSYFSNSKIGADSSDTAIKVLGTVVPAAADETSTAVSSASSPSGEYSLDFDAKDVSWTGALNGCDGANGSSLTGELLVTGSTASLATGASDGTSFDSIHERPNFYLSGYKQYLDFSKAQIMKSAVTSLVRAQSGDESWYFDQTSYVSLDETYLNLIMPLTSTLSNNVDAISSSLQNTYDETPDQMKLFQVRQGTSSYYEIRLSYTDVPSFRKFVIAAVEPADLDYVLKAEFEGRLDDWLDTISDLSFKVNLDFTAQTLLAAKLDIAFTFDDAKVKEKDSSAGFRTDYLDLTGDIAFVSGASAGFTLPSNLPSYSELSLPAGIGEPL